MMKRRKSHAALYVGLALALAFDSRSLLAQGAVDADLAALEEKVRKLRQELATSERDLAEARAGQAEAQREKEALATELQEHRQRQEPVALGPVTVGGAVRINYVYGSYDSNDHGPNRGGDGGNVELDTFRINLGLDYHKILGSLEYRWYTADPGSNYNFMHTGWLGYRFSDYAHVEVGLNRVPFGAGPYGISQSWFFDQHYYVGLADDPDVGIKYSVRGGDWDWDIAYYLHSEKSFNGRSEDSTRYGYDAVRWDAAVDEAGNVEFGAPRSGYREKNQFNARLIRTLVFSQGQARAGMSLQYGDLQGSRLDDGDHWAASAHLVHEWGNWTLAGQFSRYRFDIDGDNPWGTDDLIPMGAYDFAWLSASEAWVPALSLSYLLTTDTIGWLDTVRPYVEWSSIEKAESDFNDSDLFILGAAWARGGWYIYSDMAWSKGNYFVGNKGDDYSRSDGVGDFGVTGNDRRNYRLNLNLGYYY